MALQSSGLITLDQIHVEAGGTTSTLASVNDTDIRSLISSTAGTAVSFDDYYDASAELFGFSYPNDYSADFGEFSGTSNLVDGTPTGNSFTYQGVTCHMLELFNYAAINSVYFRIKTSGTAKTFSTTDTSWSTIEVWVNQSNDSGTPNASLNRTDATVSVANNGTTTAQILWIWPNTGLSFADYFGQTDGQTNFVKVS